MIQASMRKALPRLGSTLLISLASMTLGVQAQTDDQTNLFDWRGPFQTGVSPETYEGWAFEG